MVLNELRYIQRAGVISRTQLNLQGAMLNGVAFFKGHYDFIHEGIARVSGGHDQMNCQRSFGGTQAPNVQIMNVCNPIQLA